MLAQRVKNTWTLMDRWESPLCRALNSRRWAIQRLFAVVSRLGDGCAWYVLMALLPLLYGPTAWTVVAQMLASGLWNVVIYKLLKHSTLRPRPFVAHPGITWSVAPLDRYSFPSGHTLHAVTFSLIIAANYGELGWIVGGFAALVAMSRVILGLHYPSDVLAGIGLGCISAQLAMATWSL